MKQTTKLMLLDSRRAGGNPEIDFTCPLWITR
jgi:hypothetical protein